MGRRGRGTQKDVRETVISRTASACPERGPRLNPGLAFHSGGCGRAVPGVSWFLTFCMVLPWLWAILLSGPDRSRIAEG